MGILGLTHDENGTALEKLPVTIKVAIGEGRNWQEDYVTSPMCEWTRC